MIPVDASDQLHEMVASHKQSNVKIPSNGHQPASPPEATSVEPDIDQDLEAYLRTMSEENGADDDAGSQDSEEAADLDNYLNELDGNHDEQQCGADSEEFLHVPEACSGSELAKEKWLQMQDKSREYSRSVLTATVCFCFFFVQELSPRASPGFSESFKECWIYSFVFWTT